MTKLAKVVDLNKMIEIEVDEVVAKEITNLKAKVSRLQNKVHSLEYKISSDKRLINNFSKDHRARVKESAMDLVSVLNELDWVDIDGYLE